jgi:hypothetical protein
MPIRLSQLGRTLSGFAVLCLLVFQVASGLTAEAATYEITLSEPRVNVLDDGRYVVSLNATGPIRGLVTITITPGPSPTGEWALSSRYLVEDPTAEPHDHEEPGEPHTEHSRIVDDGLIGGSIDSAVLTGALEGIASSSLQLVSGTLKFDGVSGTGALDISGLSDPAAFMGRLTVTF